MTRKRRQKERALNLPGARHDVVGAVVGMARSAAMIGLIEAGHPLFGTVSGAKDSACAAILMLEAVRRVGARRGPARDHFIMSADTTVENHPWQTRAGRPQS
jgi:hypothetical protein